MTNTPFSNAQVKQVFFLIFISFLAILLFNNLREFLPAVLGAITIYILTRNVYRYLTLKRKWPAGLTATLIIVAALLIIVLPVSLLINMLTAKAGAALSNKTELIEGINTIAQKIKEYTNYDILNGETVAKLQNMGSTIVPQLFGATFNTLTVTAILFFILYFMLVQGSYMEDMIYQYLPLRKENVKRMSKEVNNMVVSNAIGIPVIAILQSIVALLGYFIFGVNDPFFWFVITCFTALIPVIGSTIVWLPLAVQLLVVGSQWQGIGLMVWGVVAVGAADNVFRILLTKKIGDTHPLITIFGVIVGVKIFGFIGLIFGPLLITMFLLLLRIYRNEYFNVKP